MPQRSIGKGTPIVTQNKLLKEMVSQFFFPLLLTASGLAVLVFWPFPL